jgi:serpin B
LALSGVLPRPARADTPANDVSQDVRALTDAYNASGDQLFEAFAKSPGNIVFSPYSIGTAMSLALSGARGATEQEMAEVLKQRLPRARREAAHQEATAILEGRGSSDAEKKSAAKNRLLIANALMINSQSVVVLPDYIALAQSRFGAEVFPHASTKDINAWVSQKTEGKIDHIVDDPVADVTLVNAIYLKADWSEPFKKQYTKDGIFHLTNGANIIAPMMHKDDSLKWSQQDGFRAIRLPFSGEALALIIVLPDAVDGLNAVVRRLDREKRQAVFESLTKADNRPVALTLPKFKVSFGADLTEIFANMGLRLAMSNAADFSGMTRPSVHIDSIVHRATIELAEEGVEAAAATAITMFAASAVDEPPKPTPFVVDHPFLFYVADDATGAILFQGRMVAPSKST